MQDEGDQFEPKRPAQRQRKNKPVTAAYLERAALHYLGRFSSSEKNLEAVLIRKIRRRNEGFAPPSEEQISWVQDVIQKCRRYGYVDDARYAAMRAEGMLARGKPVRMISHDLSQKGISDDVQQQVLTALGGEGEQDLDASAAAAYIRRRRFGPYSRLDKGDAEQRREKQLAAMARAGFSFELARHLLALSQDELDDLR